MTCIAYTPNVKMSTISDKFVAHYHVPRNNSSGITGSQCFYSCSTKLVGGNDTVWASFKTAYTYFRIDTASTPGYITVA